MEITSLIISIVASTLTIFSLIITKKNKEEISEIQANINNNRNNIMTKKNDGIISTGSKAKNTISRK